MRETKFTPGPWELDKHSSTTVMAWKNGRVRSVAACGGYSDHSAGTYEQNTANTYLIKAAPDMYKALGMATKHMCNQCNSCELDNENIPLFESQECTLYKKFSAVLRKARGEE